MKQPEPVFAERALGVEFRVVCAEVRWFCKLGERWPSTRTPSSASGALRTSRSAFCRGETLATRLAQGLTALLVAGHAPQIGAGREALIGLQVGCCRGAFASIS
jgi:hypothetical protein